MRCFLGRISRATPGKCGRRSSGIPCPRYSAFDVGRHDAAITQRWRPKQHEKLDRRQKSDRTVMPRSSSMRPATRGPHADGDVAETSSNRCTAFSRWTAHWGAGRRVEAAAQSTRTSARHKARRDPGPVREDPASVARHSKSMAQGTSSSALLTFISSKVLHSRAASTRRLQRKAGTETAPRSTFRLQSAADPLHSFSWPTPMAAPPDRSRCRAEIALR